MSGSGWSSMAVGTSINAREADMRYRGGGAVCDWSAVDARLGRCESEAMAANERGLRMIVYFCSG